MLGGVRKALRDIGTDPSLRDIQRYKDSLIKAGYSASHINQVMYGLQHYLEMRGRKIKIRRIPPVRRMPRVLSAGEVDRLLNSTGDVRDRAIMSLLFFGGLRSRELRKLRVGDVDLEKRLVRIRDSKNRIEDYVVISGGCAGDLRAWLRMRDERGPYLFNGKDGMLSYGAVRKAVKRAAKKAGLEGKVTPHVLRHALASLLVANGCDVSFVQKQLRHRSISITMIYVHINKELLKKEYDRYVPWF